jgi:hypothetical protein
LSRTLPCQSLERNEVRHATLMLSLQWLQRHSACG